MQSRIELGSYEELIKEVPDATVDLVLVDLPYGTTQCKWDTPIDLKEMWKALERVCKPNAAMVFTAAQPFTSALVNSNLKMFKYALVWEKSKATGYLNAKKMPMRAHEDICVFYRKPPVYNPQKWQSTPYDKGRAIRPTDVYGKQKETLVKNDTGLRYPRSVQYFKTAESEGEVIHPTQKPVALFKYLIDTYSNKGDVVLDICSGSGTTAIACVKSGRRYICYEKDEKYFLLSKERMEKFRTSQKLTDTGVYNGR